MKYIFSIELYIIYLLMININGPPEISTAWNSLFKRIFTIPSTYKFISIKCDLTLYFNVLWVNEMVFVTKSIFLITNIIWKTLILEIKLI